ncbi:MAG: SurA N-terminal domain-containing protein [Paracoccaceae bacterium]
MLRSFRSTRGNILAWGLLALLIVGLIGLYGTRSGGLVASDVASVGDEKVSADEYYRSVSQKLRALSQQLGQNISMSQARAFGLEISVLSRLLNTAALNGESRRLGISAGNDTVRQQLLATPTFQGPDGKFDPEAYKFSLQRIDLTPSEYENRIRSNVARELLRSAVSGGVTVPGAAARALLAYLEERRDFAWVRLDRDSLGEAMPVASEAVLKAYFDDNPDSFMLPESRQVTYVELTPEMLLDRFGKTEEVLLEEYENRASQYNKPEQRVLDRIVFATQAEAEAARAAIDEGEKTFDDVARARGLRPADTDLGSVTATDLGADARAVVFGAQEPGIVGPVPSALGPALFRVNAIVAGEQTPFADVRDQINRDLARTEALDFIAQVTSEVDDLLAAGATLEEIAGETDLELRQVTLEKGRNDGPVSDPEFLSEAFAAGKGEERDVAALTEGGIFVLRVDEITAPHLPEFSSVADKVRQDWETVTAQKLLLEKAETIRDRVAAGESLAAVASEFSLTVTPETDVRRNARPEGVPDDVVRSVFDLEEKEVAALPLDEGAAVVQLQNIVVPDASAPGRKDDVDRLKARQTAEIRNDLFAYYAAALRQREGVQINQRIIEQILSQFQ